jgi:hypothetical protein
MRAVGVITDRDEVVAELRPARRPQVSTDERLVDAALGVR